MNTATGIFVFLGVMVIIVNWNVGFDKDRGDYVPKWNDKSQYPKAFVHAVTALAITLSAISIGVIPLVAFIGMAIFGVLYEVSQGFINKYDIMADYIGILTALALFLIRLVQ